MDGYGKIRRQAARQNGLVTLAQLRDAGVSEARQRTLLRHDILAQADVRVFELISPETPGYRTRLRQAQLSVRRENFVSHNAAEFLHGLRSRPPQDPWVTVVGKWAPSRPDVRIITTRNLPEEDRAVVDGLHVTTIERMIVDLARFRPAARLRGVLLDARQRGLTDEVRVSQVAERRVGAQGQADVIRMCAQLIPEGADSELEQVVRDLLRSTDLPIPAPDPVLISTPNGPRQLDIAWPGLRVGIDCDGMAYHSSRAAHDSDAERRSDVSLTDYRTIYATWYRAEMNWPALHRDIRLALELNSRGR